MSQAQDLMQFAKRGHPKAIAALLNRSLQAKGISAKVSLKECCLQILVEGQRLNQEAITSFILKGLRELEPTGIETVKICGQPTGDTFPAWIKESTLKLAPQTLEPPETVPLQANEQICCPKCQSTQIMASKKGFNAGNAVVGAVLLGPLGLAGGFIGANQVFLNCLHCNYKWLLGAPVPKLNPKPQPTEAKVERMELGLRAGIGAVLSLLVGCIALIFVGKAAILVMIVIMAGFCFGVDEWTSSLHGACPHCGQEITASLSQKHETCAHCRQSICIESRNKIYRFHPNGVLSAS